MEHATSTSSSMYFEDYFDPVNNFDYTNSIWHYTIYWSVIYLVFIFSLQRFMRDKKPFDLRGVLIAWNAFLAVYNIAITLRSLPIYLSTLAKHGPIPMLCDYSLTGGDSRILFWTILFQISKLLDFGDTLFIVLRKRPLTYLHVVHHVLTLIGTWYYSSQKYSAGVFFWVMNTFMHSIMYTYFTVKMMHVHVPKPVSMAITILQMVQLLLGLLASLRVAFALQTDAMCAANYSTCALSASMYCLYLGLFYNFFLKAYTPPRKTKAHANGNAKAMLNGKID